MLEDLKAEVVAEGTTEETNYKKFLGGRTREWRVTVSASFSDFCSSTQKAKEDHVAGHHRA